MGATLVGNHVAEPPVHPLRTDDLFLAAAGQQLAQRRRLQLVAVYSAMQQIDPLLKHRADARTAPSLDRHPRERVLPVAQRYRGLHRHEATVLLGSTAVNARLSSSRTPWAVSVFHVSATRGQTN